MYFCLCSHMKDHPGTRPHGEAKRLQQLPASSSAACCQHHFLTSTVFSDARMKLKTSHGETISTTEIATNHRFALYPPSQLLNVSGYTAASPLWKHCFRRLSLGAAWSKGPWWVGKDRKESMDFIQANSGIGMGKGR